ncbi:hypothetical protein JHD50_11060 [Sulfurimonas sp. MAG313]|nr:hypothetical protein [Sulfurimonas sp. MAG313]MDF1881831.1 hypothetical protein [Sulfurimonas sp. MAG313]
MKKIVLIWLFCISFSFAGTPFTVTEIEDLYVVLENGTKLVDKKTESILKQMMLNKLKTLGVKTDTYAAESLILIIGQNEFGGMMFLNTKLMIVSQVQRAKAKETSLGITYMIDDLFDTTEPNVDMIESLEYMLSEFGDQFIEEKE